MSKLGEQAMDILNELHTERLEYESEYVPLADAANLLTAYEQTGMDPEAIERVVDAYGRGLTLREDAAERLEIIRGLSTARLRELIEMDKAGMFIPIPCKVGDTVYVITFSCGSRLSGQEIIECQVNTMRVKSDGVTIGYSCRGRYSNGNHYIGNFVFKSIGKTVFLTREAAEAALKGEQDATKV